MKLLLLTLIVATATIAVNIGKTNALPQPWDPYGYEPADRYDMRWERAMKVAPDAEGEFPFQVQ